MKQSLTFKETIPIGLMLFAIFFGAGNMIFPPLLGYSSGTNIWISISGFVVSSIGLPLLAIAAISFLVEMLVPLLVGFTPPVVLLFLLSFI